MKIRTAVLWIVAFGAIALIGLVPPTPVAFAQDVDDNQSCMECHGEADIVGEIDGEEVSMFINRELNSHSIHAEFACIDCHDDIEEIPHEDALNKVSCTQCHDDIQEELTLSVHKGEQGPTCVQCHGEAHQILPAHDENSPVELFNVTDTCGACHSDDHIIHHYDTDAPKMESLYREGVHARQLTAGNKNAPSCVSCHGFHSILPLNNVRSKTNFSNVAQTCGQCHTIERDQFLESSHGISATDGHKDAPICTDCHGEHAIFRTEDERSPVSFFQLSDNTCGRCHSSIVINEKYQIAGGKVDNYFDSYHGLALQGGSKKVAICSSCHGNHLILPSSNPRSTVSPERLVQTCGTCHPGISKNVLAAPIHSDVTLRSEYIVAWVPRLYIPLIILIIGGMLLHNGVIIWALMKEKFRKEGSQTSYQRFTGFEIFCHVMLTITFIMLAITGFALISPNSWWVTMLSFAGFTEYIRAFLHRVAGATMIVTSVLYGGYMILTKRGRSETMAFMPGPRDVVHFWQHMMFYLGRRQEPPKFDRYDYTEKMEFWALIWGIIIMVATGLILWFPILAFEYMPKWLIDIAEEIHYYEAILATLAIIVWHFFFVIFHPEEYPMSVTWLNGKMTVNHLKHRHPLEYERLKKQNIIEDGEASPKE
ncbi:MAG: cytochrome b/b6 domain-containing protein [Candidatus Hinthialibacter antarcticus]|nr:cytochrome b/b6 domain-containing protein [Candidatus Hinthialibacter antarcticus]